MPIFAVSPQKVLLLTAEILRFQDECHQNCTQCRKIHSIEHFEIGIVILQSISKWQRDKDKVDWSGKNSYFSTLIGCPGNVP